MKSTGHSSHVLITLIFLENFSKNMQIENFVRIPSVGVELFQGGGQTHKQAWIT